MSRWGDKISGVSLAPVRNIDLIKAKLKKQEPAAEMKTFLENPLDVNGSLGYKERKYSLDFNILRQIPYQSGFIAAILQTRCSQVAGFGMPFRNTKSIGYQIKHRNPGKLTTKGEREKILSLEKYIYDCGNKDSNPYDNFKRDNFKVFLSKLVRDSLTLDQSCAEVIPSLDGTPYEFIAVDAASIRIASADFEESNRHNIWGERPNLPHKGTPAYVQLVDGSIKNVYTRDEMIFGVRNHRTDMAIGAYGFSELEMLINNITNHLNAETYNSVFFKNSSVPRGIFNFKGDTMTPDQMEGFKRMWRDSMEGVSNAWRTPILQSEQGIEWIDLHTSNRDMEFGQWLEYLIKITSSVFQIDPAEINFDLSGGVSDTPLFESSQEWKLKASRDKGLRPLLSFFENMINENIIEKLDDDYVFSFVGLDELSEEQKIEQRIKQCGGPYMTINEIRRAEDLPDIECGDLIMNPTYVQAIQLKQQAEQMKTQAAQGQPAPAAQGGKPAPQGQPQPGMEGQPQEEEEDPDEHVPQYVS